MKHATIHIKDQSTPKGYEVFVGEQLLSRLHTLIRMNNYWSACIIVDENTKSFLENLTKSIWLKYSVITVSAGEKHKTIETVQQIWKEMLDNRCDRKTLVINLGGGVVGDMGGFAASTYMRGVDFVQVPTTLLAQVDASVGGKVGVNFNGIKNSIGSFQQPIAVLIDVNTLEHLPDRQLKSGFAEIIKHGLIADRQYFEKVTSKRPEEFTKEEMIEIITRSIEIKRDIIQQDLTENNQRKLVNFGHTVGHAIESMSQKSDHPLLHGEAVSVGMLAEARISEAKGYITAQNVDTIKSVLERAGLPTTYHIDDKKMLHTKIRSDKKNANGKILWTLLKQIGEGTYNVEVPMPKVNKVLDML